MSGPETAERYTMRVAIYTPENSYELAVALLDPTGRKTAFESRVVRIPDWVEADTVLVVHGPPAPNAPMRVILPGKNIQFDNRGGGVLFEEAELAAA